MSKEQRGIKRLCESCGSRFYDLGRDPIVCPVCETAFVLEKPKAKPEAKAEVVEKEAEKEEPAEAAATAGAEPEFVSLDEAAAEESGEDDADLVDLGEEEEDIPPDDGEDVFLEEDEDDPDSDVSGILGGPIDPKEEA